MFVYSNKVNAKTTIKYIFTFSTHISIYCIYSLSIINRKSQRWLSWKTLERRFSCLCYYNKQRETTTDTQLESENRLHTMWVCIVVVIFISSLLLLYCIECYVKELYRHWIRFISNPNVFHSDKCWSVANTQSKQSIYFLKQQPLLLFVHWAARSNVFVLSIRDDTHIKKIKFSFIMHRVRTRYAFYIDVYTEK